VEELGEIHGAMRSYFGRPYSPEKTATLDHIAEEIGDCATMILLVGHLFCIPLEKSLDMVIDKLEGRKCMRINPTPEPEMEYSTEHQPFKYDLEDNINLKTKNGEIVEIIITNSGN